MSPGELTELKQTCHPTRTGVGLAVSMLRVATLPGSRVLVEDSDLSEPRDPSPVLTGQRKARSEALSMNLWAPELWPCAVKGSLRGGPGTSVEALGHSDFEAVKKSYLTPGTKTLNHSWQTMSCGPRPAWCPTRRALTFSELWVGHMDIL